MGLDRSRFAVSTVAFDGHDWDTAFGCLSELGVSLVEPAFIDGYLDFSEADFSSASASRLGKAMRAHGLASRAVSAHVDMGSPDAAEKLVRRVRFAASIGADTVITNAARNACREAFTGALETVLPQCEAHGIVLNLENPGHGSDNMLPDGAHGVALLSEIGSPLVGLNYDVGNAYSYNGGNIDLHSDLDAATGVGASLHLKDLAEVGDDWTFCTIGAGVLGHSNVLGKINEMSGSRYMCLELPLRLFRPNRGDPVRRREPPDLLQCRNAVKTSLDYLCR